MLFYKIKGGFFRGKGNGMKLGTRFFAIICCLGMRYQIVVAEPDTQGRTTLMHYVIAQEDAIKKIKQDIKRLWNGCYEEISSSQYNYEIPTVLEALKKQLKSPHSSPYTIPQVPKVPQISKVPQAPAISNSSMGINKGITKSSKKTVRKESCTDEDMQAYEQRKQDLTDLIMVTMQQIESMVKHENNLGVVDNFGKTVLNYCDTFQIYNKLRELGAPFQFDTWLYWYV